MIVVSGVIPYQYEGPYPFRVGDNHSIGFSGVLFEQAMTVHTAEQHRFNGSTTFPPTFNKYTNPFSNPIEFNPRSDGANLNGTIDGIPAGMFYADYIADLRINMLITFILASIDLHGGSDAWIKDWLLWVGSTSGTQGQFTRIEFPLGSDVGLITSADPFDLGASGILWDIDLREVSYQPYSRMGRSASAAAGLTSIDLTPVFPTFMGTNGAFVKLNSREQNLSFTGGITTRTSQDFINHEMILDGDLFYADTDFCLVPETATRENLEGVITHNFFTATSFPGRIHRGDDDDRIDLNASVTLSPPSLPFGSYGIGAINNLNTHPFLVVPSGTLSFFPSISYGGEETGGAFDVFDTSIWVDHTDAFNPTILRLMNPITKDFCWSRAADLTSMTDDDGNSHSYGDQHTVGLMRMGSSYLKVATFKNSADLSQTKMGFMYFSDSTLDVTFSVPSQDWTVFGLAESTPGECRDACTDGSSVYVLTNAGNGPFRNLFIFAGETLTDSKFILGSDLNWIQAGVFGTATVYGCNDINKMFELIIDSDPGNDEVIIGTEYTFDTSAPGFPGGPGGVELYPPGEINGVPGFTDGTWMMVNQSGNIFMCRVILDGTDIVPQEGFLTDLPDPVPIQERDRYRFVVGGYTA